MPNTNRIHGKNCYVVIWDSSGASQNMGGDGNDCTLTRSVANPESTAFGDPAVQRSGSGLGDAKFSYAGWANGATGGNLKTLDNLEGFITLIIFGPGGSVAGQPKYSACMVMDDHDVNPKLKDLVTAKASFSLASGSITAASF